MKYDVMCVGIALVDNIIRGFNPEPVSASGYLAKSASLNVGGEAVNTSIAAAKLGLRLACGKRGRERAAQRGYRPFGD